jgi:hypothetical protein
MRPPKPLAFQHLQTIEMAFDGAVTPCLLQGRHDGGLLLPETGGETPHLAHRTLLHVGQPRREPTSLSLPEPLRAGVGSLASLLARRAQCAWRWDARLLLRCEGLWWLQEPQRCLPDGGRFARRLGLQTLGALFRRERLQALS